MARNYRELIVWQKAMDLVEQVYRLTRLWPPEERFGLISQIRRAAVSVPSNIAEGDGRGGDPEFIRFLQISHGSLREVETQLYIAQRLELSGEPELDPILSLCSEIGKLINGLIRSLRGN